MSKQMHCDFCKEKDEVRNMTSFSTPTDWGKITVSINIPGRYGSIQEQKDICDKCIDKKFPDVEKQEDRRQTLLDYLDNYISETVEEAMENA